MRLSAAPVVELVVGVFLTMFALLRLLSKLATVVTIEATVDDEDDNDEEEEDVVGFVLLGAELAFND